MNKRISKDYQITTNLFSALLDGTFSQMLKQKKKAKTKKLTTKTSS